MLGSHPRQMVVDDVIPLLPLSTPPPSTPPPCILPVWEPGSPTGLALECRVQVEGSTVSSRLYGTSTWYKASEKGHGISSYKVEDALFL